MNEEMNKTNESKETITVYSIPTVALLGAGFILGSCLWKSHRVRRLERRVERLQFANEGYKTIIDAQSDIIGEFIKDSKNKKTK